MEKRDVLFLLLVAGAGGYAAWEHRDWICERLGYRDLDPGRIKAIRLAKDSGSMGSGRTNWQHLQDRRRSGAIRFEGEPWVADPIRGQLYLVSIAWDDVADDEHVTCRFQVDIASSSVEQLESERTPATPR